MLKPSVRIVLQPSDTRAIALQRADAKENSVNNLPLL
jgi:hypothetical protein